MAWIGFRCQNAPQTSSVHGGQHFGEGDESDQEGDEENEDAELAAAETLRLPDSGFNAMNFGADPVVVELKTGCIACM
jgi:hypothetical protein